MVCTGGGTHRSRPTSQKTMVLCSSSMRNIRPPPATRYGVGTAALRLCRGDCAPYEARFETIGDFARCGGRVFRPVRGATGGAAPWTPAIF